MRNYVKRKASRARGPSSPPPFVPPTVSTQPPPLPSMEVVDDYEEYVEDAEVTRRRTESAAQDRQRRMSKSKRGHKQSVALFPCKKCKDLGRDRRLASERAQKYH
eukprot:378849_1